jgi:hypothetical protein
MRQAVADLGEEEGIPGKHQMGKPSDGRQAHRAR